MHFQNSSTLLLRHYFQPLLILIQLPGARDSIEAKNKNKNYPLTQQDGHYILGLTPLLTGRTTPVVIYLPLPQ